MLKRRLKLLGKVVLAFLGLLIAFLLCERFRGQIALASYRKELIAKGEKLSPQDFVRKFSEADNGAPTAIAAIERLERGTVLPHCYPPRMKIVPSGRAVVCFRESEWVETGTYRNEEWVNEKVTNRWNEVAADLKANEVVLGEVRAALAKPVLDNQLDLSEGAKMKFLHLSPVKAVTHWLGAGMQLALHEGRNRDALDYLLVQIRLPHLLAEDRIVISELVRIVIAAIARTDTWEALQADGWTDADLVKLQEAWNEQVFVAALARTLEGERVFGDVSAELIQRSNQDAVEILFGVSKWFTDGDASVAHWERIVEALPGGENVVRFLKEQAYCRVWRFTWSHQERRHYLEKMQLLIEIARNTTRDKSYLKALEAIGEYDETIVNGNYYDRLRFPTAEQSLATLSRTITRACRAETERSLVLSAIALKRHLLRHAEFPRTLDKLVPEFLPSVPTDYMDGQPLKYRTNDEGSYTLYSVGEDGKDDGGDASLLPDKTNVRNLWGRKDFLWPAPATAEEIETYRKESATEQ